MARISRIFVLVATTALLGAVAFADGLSPLSTGSRARLGMCQDTSLSKVPIIEINSFVADEFDLTDEQHQHIDEVLAQVEVDPGVGDLDKRPKAEVELTLFNNDGSSRDLGKVKLRGKRNQPWLLEKAIPVELGPDVGALVARFRLRGNKSLRDLGSEAPGSEVPICFRIELRNARVLGNRYQRCGPVE